MGCYVSPTTVWYLHVAVFSISWTLSVFIVGSYAIMWHYFFWKWICFLILLFLPQVQGANPTYGKCDDASSYCGVRDSKYPDKQPMGYPFDRLPRTNVLRLKEFLTPNMNIQDIAIRFSERIVAPIQQRPPTTTTTNTGGRPRS